MAVWLGLIGSHCGKTTPCKVSGRGLWGRRSLAARLAAAPPESPQRLQTTPELELLVYAKRIKRKRSELVEAYDLGGLENDRIIKVAQKEKAADQRLAEATEMSKPASRLSQQATPAPRKARNTR
jgi:hypothetical protein